MNDFRLLHRARKVPVPRSPEYGVRTWHPVQSSNLSRIIDLCNKLRVNSWPCHKTGQSQRLSVRVRNRCNLGAMNSLCHGDTVTASTRTTKHLHFLRHFLQKLCEISSLPNSVTTNYYPIVDG